MDIKCIACVCLVIMFSIVTVVRADGSDHQIVVYNRTAQTLFLMLYRIDDLARPHGVLRRNDKLEPQLVEAGSFAFFTKPRRKKLSLFKKETQSIVIALHSVLLGYTMDPEGLSCFPKILVSGFRTKRKKYFEITPELLDTQQFGRLNLTNFHRSSLQADCYVQLNEAIEKARAHQSHG